VKLWGQRPGAFLTYIFKGGHMTYKEYYDELSQFDWHNMFTDDWQTARRFTKESKQLFDYADKKGVVGMFYEVRQAVLHGSTIPSYEDMKKKYFSDVSDD
jgi:hypothetical protein